MNQANVFNPHVATMPVFDPLAAQPAAISHLFITVLWICAGIMVVVCTMVFGALIKYRHKEGAPEPKPYFGNHTVEIIWTVVPSMIVIWLIWLTIDGMGKYYPDLSKKDQADIRVIGHQWWWEAHYKDTGVVVANEIHIPVNKKLYVFLDSADVIHNFWVPQLARKLDAIPNFPNAIYLEAEKPGTYLGACDEYCGVQHAWMRFLVIAQTPEDYAAWVKHQQTAPPPVARLTGSAAHGAKLFHDMTCANCHAINNVPPLVPQTAPDLTHVASRETLGACILTNTPENLARWLHDPQAIKPGCRMPNLKLDDQQVADLVNYLETLQ
ncbi:MAG TPA: cytochrome c oxidase subunit II [bacterium]|nr:cytochrome c oxidase subunit II [bacterium]